MGVCCLVAPLLFVGVASGQQGNAGAAVPQAQALSPRERAVELVLTSTRSEDPFRRANAVECMQVLPDRAVPVVQLALDDPHPVVRFAALGVIGRLKLSSLVSSAERLTRDGNPSVRAAALYALRANGVQVDLSPMAAMLASQDPGLRSNVVMLLGMLGDKSASPMIRELAQKPMPRASPAQAAISRFQATEALVRLGDDSMLAALRAGPYAQFDELRVLAVQSLGRVNDRAMMRAIQELLANPPVEIQLAAAESLARFGLNDGLEVTLRAASSPSATVRAQAAMVLGLFRDPRATATLERLMGEGDEQVRLSAAASVLGFSRVLGR